MLKVKHFSKKDKRELFKATACQVGVSGANGAHALISSPCGRERAVKVLKTSINLFYVKASPPSISSVQDLRSWSYLAVQGRGLNNFSDFSDFSLF